MKPITLHGPGSEVVSAFLNLLQRSVMGAEPATGGDASRLTPSNGELANDLAAQRRGADTRSHQVLGLDDGHFAIVDRSLDWRDREVDVVAFALGGGTSRAIGQVADTDLASLPGAVVRGVVFGCYLGTGAVASLATGVAVAVDTPPVCGVGTFRSYAVEVLSGLWLYCDPVDGSLRLYNATGILQDFKVRVTAFGATAKRSAPLPDGTAPAIAPATAATGDAAYLLGRHLALAPAPHVGDALVFDGTEWVPGSAGAGTLPAPTAAGQIAVATATGTYEARDRLMSGTLAARDALTVVYEGDAWLVTSGPSAGTHWSYRGGVWVLTSNATQLQGRAVSSTAPTAGQCLTWDVATATWKPTPLPWDRCFSTGTSTVDATPTPCGGVSLAANTSATIKVLVSGDKTGLVAGCAWELLAHFANTGGVTSLRGAVVTTAPTDTSLAAAGWNVTLDVSADLIRLLVTGVPATVIDWTARWTVA